MALSLQRTMDKAKVKLMTMPNSVFISTVLFSLKQTFSDQVPTAGTNGLELLVNEKFWLSLSEDERVGLLFHEAWHVAWNHMQRGKDLEQDRYNIAGDHVINIMAKDAGFVLPQGGYCDTKYRGMSTREVYDLLPPDECAPRGPGMDIIFDDKGMSEEDSQAKQVALTNVLIKASTQSKMQGDKPGTVPGDIQVMIDEIINPKLPWQVLLQNYMTAFAKDDFTWTRPNRRFMPDFYLPSAHSEAVGHIAIAVDTSCSVTNEEFSAFVTEIVGMQETVKPEKLTIIDFDTSIKDIQEVNQDESVRDLKFTGRGGTNIKEVWSWAKKNNPVLLVVFSDMEFAYPPNNNNFPVLWICVNNPGITMPFGETIHLSTRG